MSLDDVNDESVFVLPDEEDLSSPPCSCQSTLAQVYDRVARLEEEMRSMLQGRFDSILHLEKEMRQTMLEQFQQISKLEEELRRGLQDRVTQLESQVRDLQRTPQSIHHYRVKKVLRRSW